MSYTPQTQLITRDYMIFKTNAIRNDELLTDSFTFYEQYQNLAYEAYHKKPVRFNEQHPAFTFIKKLHIAPNKLSAAVCRNLAPISKGEVLLIAHDDNGELHIDMVYFDKQSKDNGSIDGNWLMDTFDDAVEYDFEEDQIDHVRNKLTDFWNAYTNAKLPNIQALQEDILSWL